MYKGEKILKSNVFLQTLVGFSFCRTIHMWLVGMGDITQLKRETADWDRHMQSFHWAENLN